jgi:hypothetical protein
MVSLMHVLCQPCAAVQAKKNPRSARVKGEIVKLSDHGRQLLYDVETTVCVYLQDKTRIAY